MQCNAAAGSDSRHAALRRNPRSMRGGLGGIDTTVDEVMLMMTMTMGMAMIVMIVPM